MSKAQHPVDPNGMQHGSIDANSDMHWYDADEYWFNSRTGVVEQGMQSPNLERIGPFPTANAAWAAWKALREGDPRWGREASPA